MKIYVLEEGRDEGGYDLLDVYPTMDAAREACEIHHAKECEESERESLRGIRWKDYLGDINGYVGEGEFCDYLVTEKDVEIIDLKDACMLIRRLCNARSEASREKITAQARDWLKRKGYQGSILR